MRHLKPIRHGLFYLFTGALYCEAAIADGGEPPHVTDQMRADCRAEGEAGGLQGAELEAFIRGCIDDLLTIEIENATRE
jgi:hypothetical protein